jgi:hypothetical protein
LTRTNREEILAERERFYDKSFGGLTVFIFRNKLRLSALMELYFPFNKKEAECSF